MDNLPPITITNNPVSTWASRVNSHIRQNQVGSSPDFVTRQSGSGTSLKLKSKFKASNEFQRYRGEYDANKAYSFNDVVRVMPDKTYTDSSGTLIKATAGVWVCVVNVPSLALSNRYRGDARFKTRQSAIDYFPKWPEPGTKATQDSPDGRYWDLISLLPKLTVICENGVDKIHYVDSFLKPEDDTEET